MMSENHEQQNSVPEIFSISDIKDKVKRGEIKLPPIQRSFVWKPYQIENLWDSLLRGFPIGCFICKKTEDSHIEILDGQQRLTSILLGLNWDDAEENTYVKHIREMQNELKIFLDLERYEEDKNDHRKYNTRVITKSHPWGYQRSPNNKILNYSDIIKAQDLIFPNLDKKETYLTSEKRNILFAKGFPYDSCECINLTDFIKNGTYKETYKGHIDTKNKRIQLESLATNILSRKIAFQYINEDTGQTDHIPDGNDADLDSMEYLFTLINRGGTRVSNDDLNYSLIKSQLMKNNKEDGRKLINDINDNCKNVGLSPSRFVMICYFLWKWKEENKTEPNKSISLYISPTQFRRNMYDLSKQLSFKVFLEKHKNAEWITNAKDLMVYKNEESQNSVTKNPKGIPYVWFLDILQQNFYLTFIICYLLSRKNDNEYNVPLLQKVDEYIVPLITTIAIFGYRWYRQKTQKNIVEHLLERLSKQNDLEKVIEEFFNSEDYPYFFTMPIESEKLEDEENHKEEKINVSVNYIKDHGYELLLYAQKDFLSKQFKNELFTLDDMNRPFDYDHIFPQSYRGQTDNKYWDSIGNLRAWPYGKNRHDSNTLPCEKFTDEDYKNSFCEKFKDCISTVNDLRDGSDGKKKAAGIIKERIISIYKNWYDDNFKIIQKNIKEN